MTLEEYLKNNQIEDVTLFCSICKKEIKPPLCGCKNGWPVLEEELKGTNED